MATDYDSPRKTDDDLGEDAEKGVRRFIDDQIVSVQRYASGNTDWDIDGSFLDETPFTFNGNVPNRRRDGGLLIDNLPADCCVEWRTGRPLRPSTP